MAETVQTPYIELVIRLKILGWYLGCTGCMAADPTTHKTREKARRTDWRHP